MGETNCSELLHKADVSNVMVI